MAAFALATPVSARAPYPPILPDFAHRGAPHSADYSLAGGTSSRPMLVIYVQWTTLAPNVPGVPNPDAAWAARRFFGPFPSVADYFADDSFGKLQLTPAVESDTTDGGAVNDGVVVVNLGDHNVFFAKQPSHEAQLRAVIDAADDLVDFSIFDTNQDGRISELELVAHFFFAGEEFRDCAVTRGVAPGRALDGKNVDGLPMSIAGTDTTNLMTIIHETGHILFDMPDLYGYGVGHFDIAGPTCGFADDLFFRASAWQKMHLGWSYPTVVVEDGFYDVRRGESFLLYDPDVTVQRYYMVENRGRKARTYESGAPDTGLVIWRIDDAEFGIDATLGRPIDLRRPIGGSTPPPPAPNYQGSDQDAWDPGDRNTPQREFERDLPTFPNVAVRAIPVATKDAMRVFFDVRGPGVLVDPHTPRGTQLTVKVTPGEDNIVSFPVQNTGEATDTFRFSLAGLPAGFAATTHTAALADHERALASLHVTPQAGVAPGYVPVAAVGTSTSDPTVTSSAPFRLEVVLDRTGIAYTGAGAARPGAPAAFRAVVVNLNDPGTPPIPGDTVTFELIGLQRRQIATAVTDSQGVAAASPRLTVPAGRYLLTISVARLGKHAPASVSVPYTVQ